MLHRTVLILGLALGAWLLASSAAPAVAFAQATTTTGATITATSTAAPGRTLGTFPGPAASIRPQGLNPTGISYADCINDVVLDFNITLTGFNGDVEMQPWAGTVDCTQPLNRGIGTTASICWPLNVPTLVTATGTGSRSEDHPIHVRDIVAHETSGATATFSKNAGIEACSQQGTNPIAIPISVYFIPIDAGTGTLDGTAYVTNPALSADMVGPDPPTGVTIADGDTLFVVNWTPNVDSDTFGYDIYLDPIRGQEGPVPAVPLSCRTDQGLIQDGGSSSTTTTTVVDSGTTTTDDTGVDDDSGVVDDTGTTVVTTGGGISSLPIANLVGADGFANLSVPSETTGTYTITGLIDGIDYTVVVAAVDGSGNIGPPSAQACDYPATVDDFWKTYRTAGGQAGGGFCALSAPGAPVTSTVFLAGVGAVAIAFVRRRRRK